jgi:site-specific recombinase XerD
MPDCHAQHSVGRDSSPNGLCPAAIKDLATSLHGRGFAPNTINQYVQIAERFRSWLRASGKSHQPVCEALVWSFVRRCKTRYHLHHVHHLRSALGHLMRVLRDRGDLVDPPVPSPTVIDVAIQKFTAYLRDTCGLAEATCSIRARYVRQFLEGKYGSGPLELNQLCRDDLVHFVTGYARTWSRASVQVVTASLRRYLRYLQLQGICSERLVAAVPTIPSWRLAPLPRAMTEEQLGIFLSSFERSTAIGRRNYAMALLMSTLGLRASEVALLQLDDVNWRDSSLRIVRPKTRGTMVFPLPADVGQAIADYLRDGRPSTSHRYVFARHTGPKDIALNASLIRAMTVRAYRRCGFDQRWNGTHILRHTVATHLHQRGGSLKEVADLLGHRSIETSAIYAKVHLPELAKVALPWPEVIR